MTIDELSNAYSEGATPYNVSDGEQRLYGAVILRAIADAVWIDPDPTGSLTAHVNFCGFMSRRAANRLRDEAVFWLTLDNVGFNQCCEKAGLSPSVVRKCFLEASDEDKARWLTADLSLHDLRTPSELRG